MTTTTEGNATASASTAARISAFLEVRETVRRNFPKGWPLVESCLSAEATLLLEDAIDPTALILVGAPAGLKTTVLNIVEHTPFPTYRSDKFTSKAFVSHHAGVPREKLAEVDLLPRIKYRVLLTPELAPMFRARQDDLNEHFAILTRVLDGQGLVTDSGIHGQRGYRGDYMFAWLGATTPLPPAAWQVMAQLGSRLFFLPVSDDSTTPEELDEAIRGHAAYATKVKECREVAGRFSSLLLPNQTVVRSVAWDRSLIPDDCASAFGNLASALACLRGVVPTVARGTGNRPEFGPPIVETPFRAQSVIFNIARGHALVCGRQHLTLGDVALVVPIALGSCPDHRRRLFLELLLHSGKLTAPEAAKSLRVATETARSYLKEMDRLGLVHRPTFTVKPDGDVFELNDRWEWFLSDSFKELAASDPSASV